MAVRHAYGATSLAAKARLLPGLLQTPAPELPLAALAAARPHLATLAALGCTRWGELRALPRAGVARRFGAPLLQALDQACGQGPDSYPWLLLPEVFEARLELAAQVETAPALLFGARRLLEQLQYWLQLRQQAVLALVLCWTMDARRDTATQGELLLRCAEPSCDTAHLQRLLAEHLARISLPAPVLYLQLRSVETLPRAGHSASLLPEAQRPGDSLQQLLERLAARLGQPQVLQWSPRADHRPERMQLWQAASNATVFMAEEASRSGPGGSPGGTAPALALPSIWPAARPGCWPRRNAWRCARAALCALTRSPCWPGRSGWRPVGGTPAPAPCATITWHAAAAAACSGFTANGSIHLRPVLIRCRAGTCTGCLAEVLTAAGNPRKNRKAAPTQRFLAPL